MLGQRVTYSKTLSMKWLHPGILGGDFNLSKDPLVDIGQKEGKLKDDTAVQQEIGRSLKSI